LKSVHADPLPHCIPFFFSSIWWMQNIWSVADLLHQIPHWWSPVISSAYRVSLDNWMLDKILYVYTKVICLYNCYCLFYHPSCKSVQWSTPSTPQAIPHYSIKINMLRISEQIFLHPALISSAGIWSVPGDWCLLAFKYPSQPQRHWDHALVALLSAFQSAEHI